MKEEKMLLKIAIIFVVFALVLNLLILLYAYLSGRDLPGDNIWLLSLAGILPSLILLLNESKKDKKPDDQVKQMDENKNIKSKVLTLKISTLLFYIQLP